MAVVIKVGETEAVSVDIGEKVYIQGDPGFSPTIEVTDITGGHRLTITDINGDKTVDVMNGAKGDTGVTGNGIDYITLNADYTLTVHYTNGTEWTSGSIRGEKGEKGDTGTSISGAILNADYTLTLTFTDGSSYTTPPIRGAQGEPGPIGPTPDISIGTVTTGAAGSQAEATMTGTPEQPVLNLTIPRGDPGEVTQAEFDELADEVSQQKSALTANFGFEYTTAPGYINGDGGISSAGSSTQEVYSSLMPVYEGQQLRFILAPTTGQSMWMAIAYYRENGTFISRIVLVSNSTVSGGIITEHTIEGADTAYIRVTWRTYGYAEVTLYDVSYKATISDIYGKISGLEDDLKISETVEIPWEAGNIYMTPTQIYYNMSSGDKRIRTPQNFVLSLNAGDTISLPPDNTVNMYVGWKKPNGEYAYVGWISQSYTATLDTEYYLLVAFKPERVLESVDELSQYITVTRNSDVKTELEQLDSQVGALESAVDHGMDVPDYFTENLDDAITAAQTAMLPASINGESFVFLSDIHWENNEKHSPALVKAVTDALPIENTIFCGDTFNGGTQETVVGYMNDVRKRFTAASPHFLSVYGNHDGNQLDGGTAFTHNEFYTLMQKQADYYVQYEAPCYYYMDNEATKTRFVFLDSRTGTPSTASAQIAWLQTITNSAPTGWHFIVFCHVIYYPDSGGSYSDPSTWIMSPFMTNVCTALDAVNTTGDKKVEAIFGGHCHLDYNSQTSGGIPIVLIDCDTKQTVSGNPQTAGTIGEQCLDIVTVDYSAEKIYCTRIGRGASRTISY